MGIFSPSSFVVFFFRKLKFEIFLDYFFSASCAYIRGTNAISKSWNTHVQKSKHKVPLKNLLFAW